MIGVRLAPGTVAKIEGTWKPPKPPAILIELKSYVENQSDSKINAHRYAMMTQVNQQFISFMYASLSMLRYQLPMLSAQESSPNRVPFSLTPYCNTPNPYRFFPINFLFVKLSHHLLGVVAPPAYSRASSRIANS